MNFFRAMSTIKAISFDLDDTLYENHSLMITAEQQLQTYLREHYPQTQKMQPADWRSVKRRHLQDTPELASDMGELRRRTLHSGLQQCGYQDQALKKAVSDCFDYFYYQRSNFQVNKTICSLLAELAEKVPLIAITNGNVNLQQIGIADYFTHCLKASLQQPMKPHPMMFDRAATILGIPHKQVLHVGDNLEKDVMGAIAAGMQSAWYACNRKMHINHERITVLPHVKLTELTDLKKLVG
ncbi:HAD-IA family hydrolase [Aliiglaciecola litoralis]|uniref:5-amino-6-(5-phospho-D-ribitylamino)uracil phosphatase YigB n=1 Tax=Aliiglaciecola litoralis TaxID=582857 RepID=A0ABP3WTA2_9ALTE